MLSGIGYQSLDHIFILDINFCLVFVTNLLPNYNKTIKDKEKVFERSL